MDESVSIKFYPAKTNNNATTSFFAFDPYIDEFVRPIFGPTASSLLNELTMRSLVANKMFEIEIKTLSMMLGTGNRSGASSPSVKQLTRLTKSGLIYQLEDKEYLVPQTIQPLNAYQVSKISKKLEDKHCEWLNRLLISPLSTQRRRLDLLYSRLIASGYELDDFRNILNRSGLHPSIIGEYLSASWADLRAEKTG